MRRLRRFSAILVGIVFLLAGILKLMDPLGAELVVREYLAFFHLGFLRFAASVIAVFLALLEAIVGAALVTGVWRKQTAIVSMSMMGAFTLVTIVLLIFNPKMDCGCFGEAIHLTHLQSFIKNVALLGLLVLAFIPFSKLEPTRKIKYVSFSIASVSICFFLIYSSRNLPLRDFTSYKPGIELEPGVTDLYLCKEDGSYEDELLFDEKVLAISCYSPQKIKNEEWQDIAKLMDRAAEQGYTTLLLSAIDFETMRSIPGALPLMNHCYTVDRRELMALNRSNGGATYLSEGQVLAKWSLRHAPEYAKLAEISELSSAEVLIAENHTSDLKLQAFLLYVFAVVLLL